MVYWNYRSHFSQKCKNKLLISFVYKPVCSENEKLGELISTDLGDSFYLFFTLKRLNRKKDEIFKKISCYIWCNKDQKFWRKWSRSEMKVVATSISDTVTMSLSNVVKTLLQHHDNIKHWVSRSFYYGQFWFPSCHQRELQKYLSNESSLWQARCTLVNLWLCPLLMCKLDQVVQ